MRDPGPIPYPSIAQGLRDAEKRLDVTRDDLLSVALARGYAFGQRERDSDGATWRWEIVLRLFAHPRLTFKLKADFRINRSPVEGFEYHDRPTYGPHSVPPGYHWDVFPPLYQPTPAEIKLPLIPHAREWPDPQPKDHHEALDLVLRRWNIDVMPPPAKLKHHGRR